MSFVKGKDDKASESTPAPTRSTSSGANVEAFLGRGSKVNGNLSFSGPVELDGNVEGEIHAQEKLIIGEGAVIKATISGGEIVVKGTVQGDITASKRLSLQKPAKVTGNISSTNLSIEEGVFFEGNCSMKGTTGEKSVKEAAPAKASA